MENSIMTTAQAKEVLRKAGYFVDALWHTDDVQDRYQCDKETAMEILEIALTTESAMESAWINIHDEAMDRGLKEHDGIIL